MRIWFLGDSVILPSVQALATSLGAELIDSSVADCSMEEVWGSSVRDMRMKRASGDHIVIIFINNPDYDSEVIILVASRVAPSDAKIILLIYPEDARAAEGFDHFEGDRFKLGRLDALDEATVTMTLNALLS